MNKLYSLVALTIALLSLTAAPSLASPFAHFEGGLFGFDNQGDNSTFNTVDGGAAAGAYFQFLGPGGQKYTNIAISLSSSVFVDPASPPPGAYTQGGITYQDLKDVTLTFTNLDNNTTLLQAKGTGLLSGVLGQNSGGHFQGPNDLKVENVTYASDYRAFNNSPTQPGANNYISSISLYFNGPLALDTNNYFKSFSATANGDFNAAAVPEASTLLGFGMLLGGGLLGLRRMRRAKSA